MSARFCVIALGLLLCAGCGDIGGGKRRQASGSVGGVGLVGSDVNSLAAGPNQPAAAPAAVPNAGAMTGPAPGMPPGQPATGQPLPGQIAGQPAPGSPPAGQGGQVQPAAAPQPGGLPGLPGVGVPGQPQPNTVTERAQAGATGKGNYGGPGVVTTPISVYFQAQERLIYDSVTYAVKLYEAEHGNKPKTEEEFMKQVIEANQIRLPQLPPGSKYKYDPQNGELLVEQPQR